MSAPSFPDTEAVVLNHLRNFVEERGIPAILDDYDEDARFYSEARVYSGKAEIRGFFEEFMANLPAKAPQRFSLRSMRVVGDVAFITWSVGREIPLGTDAFVVRNGKVVSQMFAMCPAS